MRTFRSLILSLGVSVLKFMDSSYDFSPVGSISPNMIHVPGIYVDRIVQATEPKMIEVLATAKKEELGAQSVQGTEHTDHAEHEIDPKDWRHRIARRAAREIQDGYYVNLGVGIPTLVPEVSKFIDHMGSYY